MRNNLEPPTVEQACTKALRWLATRSLSTMEIQQRLQRLGAADVVIEQVMAQLQAWGYVNDRRFAEGYARYRKETCSHGSRRLTYDLIRKGIDAEQAGEIVNALLPEREDRARALHLAQQQWQRLQKSGRTDRLRDRLGVFLQRRGYPFEVIVAVLEEVMGKAAMDGNHDNLTL
ncbi:regulatory protein RecX [Heliophilum fasciatum]|uniref:Regulatory protein RecX n=1 Tax=Heliophilum fasciatum TaxID=35700 RepID=A0A4R2RKW4_9FIRM|nr:regulatory protein RecX [Heliophilum fasciatum]TCP63478.1 regulatory protein [Heliophilum fasciatum]